MFCHRCKVKMRVARHTSHKHRKWICPRCGRARMQRVAQVGKLRSSGE